MFVQHLSHIYHIPFCSVSLSSLSILLFFLFSQDLLGRNPWVHSHVSLFPACLLPMRPVPTQPASLLLAQPFENWVPSCRCRHTAGTRCIWGFLFICCRESRTLSPASWISLKLKKDWLEKSGEHLFTSGTGYTVVLISPVVPSGMRRGGTGPSCARSYPLSGWWLEKGLFSSWVTSLNIVADHQSYSAGRLCWLVEVSKCSEQLSRTREATGWLRGYSRESQRIDWREPKLFAWGWDTDLREVTLHSSTYARRRSWPFFLFV